jgi:hypothetical protein
MLCSSCCSEARLLPLLHVFSAILAEQQQRVLNRVCLCEVLFLWLLSSGLARNYAAFLTVTRTLLAATISCPELLPGAAMKPNQHTLSCYKLQPFCITL